MVPSHLRMILVVACVVAGLALSRERGGGQNAEPTKAPALPKIVELTVEPAALSLTNPRDSRGFIVRGKAADGSWFDLTRTATVKVSGDAVRIVEGFVEPIKDSKAEILLAAAGLQAALPVTVTGQAAARLTKTCP